MKTVGLLFMYFYINNINSHELHCRNVTYDPTVRQLTDFKRQHPKSIGLITTTAGDPVEIRDTNLLNTDLFSSTNFFDTFSHLTGERISQRVISAKGIAVRGYFEVTNDVSKYTKADVFNGIGKKTPLRSRFSIIDQERGGNDLSREYKGFSMKLFTNEGILDFLTVHIPVWFTRDPADFALAFHTPRHPKTSIPSIENLVDYTTLRPWLYNLILWLYSDLGIPDGYRKMDTFALHTYELNNKKGERYYARFNFRSQQGLASLTPTQVAAIQATDLDYYVRDMYSAVAEKNYPSWRLEMDVMSLHDIKHVDYDPFDMLTIWKNGTYRTVPIGRVVLNEMPENQFRDSEQIAFNPTNLVPGIPGPIDNQFQMRQFVYKDAQNHRLGPNYNNIEVNRPEYAMTYNRDSRPPIRSNMKDAPTYYPNSFNGPIPYVDETKPKELLVLLQSNAVDLQPSADFYNKILTDAQRQTLVDSLVASLQMIVSPVVRQNFIKLLYLTDVELGNRVQTGYNLVGSCYA